jgi:hypothetical protein
MHVTYKKGRSHRMTQAIEPEQRMDKKVIALAIICIILAASLVGVIAVYQPAANSDSQSDLQAQIAAKDAQISTLQTQITSLQSQLNQASNSAGSTNSLQQQVNSLQAQLSAMNSTLYDLQIYQKIAYLLMSGALYSGTFIQDANSSTTVWTDMLPYAGYIVVNAQALANTTYAEVRYTFSEVNFDYNATIGTSGTVIFPVLGTESNPVATEILIGNVNQTQSNSVNATLTYYY